MGPKSKKASEKRKPIVLIVDDEPHIVDFLQLGFEYEGFTVFAAASGREALKVAQAQAPDIIVLDIMLPGLDGLEVTRQIRSRSDAAIILLTAKDDVEDRIIGLDLGADDYITKPFNFKELMAHVRAVLRRYGKNFEDVLTFQDIILDRGAHAVTYHGRSIDLTPREFDLLEFFLMHPRQVLTRDMIETRIWGNATISDDNIIDVYISHLREKLGDTPPRLLQTVRGVGYALRG